MIFLKRRAVFLTAFLLAHICVASFAHAEPRKDPRKDFIVALDEQNIRDFLREVSEISTGQRPDLLDDDLIDYFANHIAEKGEFKSSIRYQIPGFPTQDSEMVLAREEYINSVINGRFLMEDYKAEIDIQDLKIAGNGKSATFKSVTKEKGRMPMAKDEEKKQIEMIPIQGESTCEQRLIVSFNNFIQMAKAECTTLVSFDPFAGKPLVPQ